MRNLLLFQVLLVLADLIAELARPVSQGLSYVGTTLVVLLWGITLFMLYRFPVDDDD